MTDLLNYLINFLSSGAIILLALPLLALLLDFVFDWLSQGRLPSFIPRLTLASLAQGATILATLLLVAVKKLPNQLSAMVFLIIFVQILILIFCAALVQQVKKLTRNQVRKVLEERILPVSRIEPVVLNTILEIGDELVVEDLHPHGARTRLSGEDNSHRRKLFLRITDLLVSREHDRIQEEDLLLPGNTRRFFARTYTFCGWISFVLFVLLLFISTMP